MKVMQLACIPKYYSLQKERRSKSLPDVAVSPGLLLMSRVIARPQCVRRLSRSTDGFRAANFPSAVDRLALNISPMEHFDGNKSQRLRDAVITIFFIAATALAIGGSFILAPIIEIGAGWIFLAIVFSSIGYMLAMQLITKLARK